MNVETILSYTILAGLLSIVYGFLTGKSILNARAGNPKMQEIQRCKTLHLLFR
jgi:K(+)-stimulated pyrophosphate-energized sodium pump